jgi:hypothetical protein
MKLHLYIVPVLCVALMAFTPGGIVKHKTDVESYGLKGKVKSLREQHYKSTRNVKGTIKGDSLVFDTKTMFNEKGYIIETYDYPKSGLKPDKHTWSYDDSDHKLSGYDVLFYSTGDSLYTNIKYKYEGNNVMEENQYNSDGSVLLMYIYKYDNNGNELEWNTKDTDGTVKHFQTYTYDDNGNCTENSEYDDNGNAKGKEISKFDAKGNAIEFIKYNADGSLDSRTTEVYDDAGNATESYRYDATGKLVMKNTYKYEFDKIGNIIKEIVYTNGKAANVTEYQITYYN